MSHLQLLHTHRVYVHVFQCKKVKNKSFLKAEIRRTALGRRATYQALCSCATGAAGAALLMHSARVSCPGRRDLSDMYLCSWQRILILYLIHALCCRYTRTNRKKADDRASTMPNYSTPATAPWCPRHLLILRQACIHQHSSCTRYEHFARYYIKRVKSCSPT